MTKSATIYSSTTVRDSKSGRFVTVKGAGALKGKMSIKGVDLTKPISGQALNGHKKSSPTGGDRQGQR